MNIADMLDQSHLLVIQVLDDLPEVDWDTPGVCGDWSVKDSISHLTSYELVLVDALKSLSGNEPGEYLRAFLDDPVLFDATQVEARKFNTAQQVEDEYQEVQLQSSALLAHVPADRLLQTQTTPWSRTNQSLTNFIQMICEHTRKHCAQIATFRESRNLHGLADL